MRTKVFNTMFGEVKVVEWYQNLGVCDLYMGNDFDVWVGTINASVSDDTERAVIEKINDLFGRNN